MNTKKNRLHFLLHCWPLALALLLLTFTSFADVTLPASMTVIEAEAFMNDTSLTGALDIAPGVSVIGARAFEGCTGLTGELIIPQGVQSIGPRAFAGCTGLTGVVRIPSSVTFLAEDAFEGTNLTIQQGGSEPGTGEGGDDDDNVITMTDLPEGIHFEMTSEGAIITGYYGAMDAELRIPSTISGIPVVAIAESAFQDCYALTGSVIIPDTVTHIGASAFFGCTSLDGVLVIPESVVSIGDFAFYECLSLTGGLSLPASVESVGESAFAFCESMTGRLQLPAGVALGKRCFQSAGFTGSISIPANMSLGANVFTGTALDITWEAPSFTYNQTGSVITITGWNGPVDQGLVIPSELNNGLVSGIAAEAFADIGLQGAVEFPSSVVYIGDSAFRSNPGITELRFSKGLSTIAAYAFADCTGLTGAITLPSSMVNLDATAFAGTSVTVKIASAE